MSRITSLLFVLLIISPSYLFGHAPDKMLANPALEARARALSQKLRCPVCQNETIDESHAQVARDLRLLLRERLLAGDSDQEALDFLVARYGEFILLRPRFSGINLILWSFGPVLFILVLGLLIWRKRAVISPPAEPLAHSRESKAMRLLQSPPSKNER